MLKPHGIQNHQPNQPDPNKHMMDFVLTCAKTTYRGDSTPSWEIWMRLGHQIFMMGNRGNSTIDLNQLIQAGLKPGNYFIFTCSCGDPGCGGYWKPFTILHDNKLRIKIDSEYPKLECSIPREEFIWALEDSLAPLASTPDEDFPQIHEQFSIPEFRSNYLSLKAESALISKVVNFRLPDDLRQVSEQGREIINQNIENERSRTSH